jgi:hypothetical protein
MLIKYLVFWCVVALGRGSVQQMAQESFSQMLQFWSPDVAPSDFRLFRPLKQHLGGRRFHGNEVEMAVRERLWMQPESHPDSLPPWNLWTAEMGQNASMYLGLCWQIMIIQSHKWATFNVVMTSHLVFMTYGTLLNNPRNYKNTSNVQRCMHVSICVLFAGQFMIFSYIIFWKFCWMNRLINKFNLNMIN